MLLSELLVEYGDYPKYQWDYKDDERFKTLSSLVKYNNGVWKSAKQRDFLTGKNGIMGGDASNNGHQRRDYDNMKNWFGVEADSKKNEYVIQTSGSVAWAPGKKAWQRFEWMWVLDDYGVVKKYKLGFKITGPGSSGVDKKKTKLDWERSGKIDTKAFDDSAKEKAAAAAEREKVKKDTADKSQFVGSLGEWIEDKIVKIEKIVDLGEGDYGIRWMTIIKDEDGNTYNYFGWPKINGTPEEIYKGSYSMRAKVKKQYVNKNGIKVTVVGYPKFGVKK